MDLVLEARSIRNMPGSQINIRLMEGKKPEFHLQLI